VNEVKKRIQGTLGYIAPEQAHLQAITAQTDVYNFGAMMYKVLAGEIIPTALQIGADGVSMSAVTPSMVKLPTPLNKKRIGIPDELSDLVQECIQLKPQDRVPGMGQVAERLELIVSALGDTHMGLRAVSAK
jgi:serine/threonine-protein kinase